MKHFVLYKLLSNAKHSFISLKACVANLLEALDSMTEAMSNGYPVDIIFTDFVNAFDRKQRVVKGEHKTEWKDVTSEELRGSVLGPLLFVLSMTYLKI